VNDVANSRITHPIHDEEDISRSALIAASRMILQPWRISTRRNCNCPQFESRD